MKTTPTVAVLLASSAFGRTEAFVPVSPGAPSLTRNAPVATPVSSTPYSTMTSSSLAMKGNLVDRFIRVFNANINKVVSGLEDPEKVIVQAVEDMQVSKILCPLILRRFRPC